MRAIQKFDHHLDDILAHVISTDFVTSDSGWLTDTNTRFLFLLGGFDELVLEREKSNSIKDFLEQVSNFQRSSSEISERQHLKLETFLMDLSF